MGYIRKKLFDTDIANVENEQILQNEVSLGRWVVDALTLLMTKGEAINLKEKLPIKVGNLKISYIPDIYLEHGCAAIDIQGPTMIEIKSHLSLDNELRQPDIYRYLLDSGIVNKIIVLYLFPTEENSSVNTQLLGRIQAWEAKEFIDNAKKALNDGKGEVNAAIRKGMQQKPKHWKEIRNERIEKAKNDLTRYDCVLFLGAGVSVSANLPKWDDMLRDLLGDTGVINSIDFDGLSKESGYSYLVIARYIQKLHKMDNASMVEAVRNLLYSKNKAQSSELIRVICKIIGKQMNIRSVITYNYDTLIEENLNDAGVPNFSVYKSTQCDYKSLPIYHVHGVIHRDNARVQRDEIVLSEEHYHKVYTEVFDWSNVEQLHALTRCTCYFIGLSMADPNLRRLLEIATKDCEKAVRHYAFLERKCFSDDEDKAEQDYQAREDILADLGLNVIWYEGNDNHKELPQLLMQFVDTSDS